MILATGIVASSATISLHAQQPAAAEVTFETDTLIVRSQNADHAFTVEIADSFEETARGLMFRESMPLDAGMLFDFDPPREPNMWMKNTLISLDMLFLDKDGIVVAIARNAEPHSLRRISPGMPVNGVLEINGGLAQDLGIEPGDVVLHSLFGNELPQTDAE